MKHLVYSYTLLNTWDICPHQAARKYIVRDLPREPETPEMAWGNEVHAAMENRLQGRPLPEPMAAYEKLVAPLDGRGVQPEQKLGVTAGGEPCDFFAGDVWLRGKLDAPVVYQRAALLLDWKTGKPREEPLELEIGAMLLQAHQPRIDNIHGHYVWLKENRLGKLHDLSDTTRTWTIVKDKTHEIETAIGSQNFIKTPGPLCAWCPVTDCQHNRRGK